MPGNSFQNWGKITPRHNSFINAILQAPAHVIATIRSKQDYVLSEKNGKMVPEKVGLKGVTRDGMDYELTVVFDVDSRHMAKASKDRTNLFVNVPDFQITEETGKKIKDWCEMKGAETSISNEDLFGDIITEQIEACNTLEELYKLFNENPSTQEKYKADYIQQREKINQLLKSRTNGKFSIES